MIYKTIDVRVPFEGCKHCEKFNISKVRIYAKGEEYLTYYSCTNYEECENAYKIASMIKVMEFEYEENERVEG